ncbi:MAG: hypothetical protein ABI169_09300, partial [Chitinophagaceae bacterium]
MMSFLVTPASVNAQKAPRAQWHNYIDHQDGGISKADWSYSVIPTHFKEYISCGYTVVNGHRTGFIAKLNKFGQTQWFDALTTIMDHGTAQTLTDLVFFQVVEKSSGVYVAVGKGQFGGTGNVGQIVIMEFDDNGVVNNSLNQYYPAPSPFDPTATCRGYSIAFSPDKLDYWVTGRYNGFGPYTASHPNTSYDGVMVSKINPATASINTIVVDGANGANGRATGGAGLRILTNANPSALGGYDVFVGGYNSAYHTGGIVDSDFHQGSIFVDSNRHPQSGKVYVFDKDILLLKLKSDNTINFTKYYSKADLYPNYPIYYTETGPLSARNTNISVYPKNQLSNSAIALQYLQESANVDERGTDLIMAQDGNLAMSAMVNIINTNGNSNLAFDQSNGGDGFRGLSKLDDLPGVIDPNRGNLLYDNYCDADAYLIKIDPSNGNILTGTKNVGHFGGDDFRLSLTQTNLGDYVIAGSTADYYTSSSRDVDLYTPALVNAFVVGTSDAVAHDLWRRSFIANEETAICNFGLAATADDGFVISGNNGNHQDADGNNGDDISINKFAPSCAVQKSNYALDGLSVKTLEQGTTVNWTNNTVFGTPYTGHVDINSLVIVPPGTTLNITNSDIRFASSDHVYDYWQFDNTQNLTGYGLGGTQIGIIVQPGGVLNINNSKLEGLNDCNRYMWDGLTIMGDPNAAETTAVQGALFVSNNSVIKDARFGAAIDNGFRFTVAGPTPPITDVNSENYSTRYWYMGGYGGGIVTMANSTEQDCRFGFTFSARNTGIADPSWFVGNQFKVTSAGMADP